MCVYIKNILYSILVNFIFSFIFFFYFVILGSFLFYEVISVLEELTELSM